MNADDMQAGLRAAAEKAIAYRTRSVDGLQRPIKTYQEMRKVFDAPLPEVGAEFTELISELARQAEPGLHATTGSRFFGWVIGASHPVGVAADWLTSAWGQNCGNHTAAPAAAAVEEIAARWLLDLLDLPRESSVGFVTGATVANFVCLGAARNHVLRQEGWDVEANGLFAAPSINVFIGDDAHTTVFTSLQMLGLGHDRVIRIATDEQGRMRTELLAKELRGRVGPSIVIAQAGQINTGAFDAVGEIAEIVAGRNAWVHVDGAFGLWARACISFSELADGIDRADSWATDGHKWLQTPYDCGYAIVRHSEAHRRAMTSAASYLPVVTDDERDPSLYVPELSRRARGFATWAMIRHLGRAGISEMVSRHCRLARRLAGRLRAEPGIQIMNDVVLNQIIVRFGADEAPTIGDGLTKDVIQRIQSKGTCFAGGARWRNRWVMRLSVISWPTMESHIDQSADAIIEAWRDCQSQKKHTADR